MREAGEFAKRWRWRRRRPFRPQIRLPNYRLKRPPIASDGRHFEAEFEAAAGPVKPLKVRRD
jgi:hypothetical protein